MVRCAYLLIITAYVTAYAQPKSTHKLNSISIESERATYQRHKTPHPHVLCIHEGNVHVILSNGAHAYAGKLEAHIRETSGEKKDKVHDALETITLDNNVAITHQNQTVMGEHALLDAPSHICTIVDNVTITKRDEKGHTITTKARKATLDLTTNRVTLEGSSEKPVHTLIHISPHKISKKNGPHRAP